MRRPGFDARALKTGIAHIGVGAFHRAHQAFYTEPLLARDPSWGTLGVSLGGYYAARAAAFEPRLRAVVVSGGCYDYGALIRDRSPHSFATFSYGCGAHGEEG